jgi:phage terminase small subunit
MAKKLTDKQQRFVEEYLIDLNATQAAIRAGYKVENARQTAAENLSKPYIASAIETALAERSRRTGVNADRVVRELAKIAFLNPADVVDSHGQIKENASPDDLACIQSIKYEESDSMNGSSVKSEVKFCSKEKALELLGKHMGVWNDKLNVSVNIPVVFEGEANLEE